MPAFVLLLLELLAGPAELAAAPSGMATIAVIAAAVLLVTMVVAVHVLPVGGSLVAFAVRQRAERTIFLALCDPDAAGRPRPRAPSVRPGVA